MCTHTKYTVGRRYTNYYYYYVKRKSVHDENTLCKRITIYKNYQQNARVSLRYAYCNIKFLYSIVLTDSWEPRIIV